MSCNTCLNSSNYYDSYGFSHKHLLEDSVAVESISGMVNQQLQLREVSKLLAHHLSHIFIKYLTNTNRPRQNLVLNGKTSKYISE